MKHAFSVSLNVRFITIGMIQPENPTLEGFENLDLSDLTLGVDWDFAQVLIHEIKSIQENICLYTGCIKKKVIELWSAIARPIFNLQK